VLDLPHDGCCITAVAFSSDEKVIAVASAGYNSTSCSSGFLPSVNCRDKYQKSNIKVFRVADGSVALALPNVSVPVWDLAWTLGDKHLLYLTSRRLNIWNVSESMNERTVELSGDSNSLAISPNGKLLAVSDGQLMRVFLVTE
jgi:WD40 repeat protein